MSGLYSTAAGSAKLVADIAGESEESTKINDTMLGFLATPAVELTGNEKIDAYADLANSFIGFFNYPDQSSAGKALVLFEVGSSIVNLGGTNNHDKSKSSTPATNSIQPGASKINKLDTWNK